MWWNRRRETRPDILATLSKRVGWVHYALLLLMPICAIPVYTVLYNRNLHIPIVHIVGVPLMYAGNGLLVMSVLAIALRRRTRPAVATKPIS